MRPQTKGWFSLDQFQFENSIKICWYCECVSQRWRQYKLDLILQSLFCIQKLLWLYFKWAFLGLFFFIFASSIHLTIVSQMLYWIIRRWLDSNRGPLVLEATALPTEPQPLPTYNLPIQSDFFRTNPSLNCFGGIWWFRQFCVETMQGVNFESITNLHHSGLRTEPAEITAEPSGGAIFDTFRHFFNFSFISKSEMKQKMKRVSSTFCFEYFFQKNGHQLFFPEFLCPEVIFCVLQFRKKKKSNFLFVFRSNKIISFRVENSAVWIAQKWNLNYSNDDDVLVDDYFFKQKLLRLE